ncbi:MULTISPECIES: DNA-binding protein [unclassified Arthrobacter]|uniref:DNA-binding protein n=1 Tax=unclassified Arthrobacter TaxID=235627 RepID=UPI002E07DBFA|nr:MULTISPECIES: DNA-binding protein [unclassified Arthrobacter]MEC5192687.1 chromosome segregation ATPase [Arthrobacter sp. MP_M4]MEC5204170.1 chromosome segregation ATPase [Arthrobacter sp. MP_M7]
MALSVKDRVFAAAEQISAERRPTVSTVRAAAGVSNADATRYLKEWVEEKQAAGGQVAATPATVLEQAARLAGACWAEASTVANERHAAAEAIWAQEKKDLGQEISELVADLDKVTGEKDAAVTELTARVTALETQAAEMTAQLEQARAAEQQTSAAAADAAARVAAAEARAETLQNAHDALLQRIVPETPDKNDQDQTNQ